MTHDQFRSTSAGPASAIARGDVYVDGRRLHYAVRWGEGQPLLLCNGIGANLELALPLLEALGNRSLLIVDVPGTGGSPAGCFWPSVKRYARMVVGVADRIGFGDTFAVAGVSWGGGLAQQIARDYPARVSHLILMATSPGVLMVPGKPSALLRMVTPQRYFSRGYMVRHAPALYGGGMRQPTRHAKQHARRIKKPGKVAYLQQIAAIYQFTSLPWLWRLCCPALVMNGDDDPLVRPINARILAALLPNAKLVIIENGGHLFMTLKARQVATLIDEFLAP